MKKIILRFEITDGYTYSFWEHLPFEYKNKHQAELDFLELLIQAKDDKRDFSFAGMNFYSDFTDEYEILTLDEWFEKYKEN